jgi:transketolase
MAPFSALKTHPLHSKARSLRLDILEMINHAGFGHIGSAFSSLDILISLYNSKLFNFKKDHFILSAGHLCASLYAVLADAGYFDKQELFTFAQFNSRLQGHATIDTPGVNYSAGSLGQGLSYSIGLALGDPKRHVVCLSSDGEHNEGQVWEAIMAANKFHLGNLISIVDYNGCQIGGTTQEIMPLEELAGKYLRFGWTVTTVDGHNFYELERVLKKSKDSSIYPACIIAKTVLGKGVSFMENNYQYHDIKKLAPDLFITAKNELQKY